MGIDPKIQSATSWVNQMAALKAPEKSRIGAGGHAVPHTWTKETTSEIKLLERLTVIQGHFKTLAENPGSIEDPKKLEQAYLRLKTIIQTQGNLSSRATEVSHGIIVAYNRAIASKTPVAAELKASTAPAPKATTSPSRTEILKQHRSFFPDPKKAFQQAVLSKLPTFTNGKAEGSFTANLYDPRTKTVNQPQISVTPEGYQIEGNDTKFNDIMDLSKALIKTLEDTKGPPLTPRRGVSNGFQSPPQGVLSKEAGGRFIRGDSQLPQSDLDTLPSQTRTEEPGGRYIRGDSRGPQALDKGIGSAIKTEGKFPALDFLPTSPIGKDLRETFETVRKGVGEKWQQVDLAVTHHKVQEHVGGGKYRDTYVKNERHQIDLTSPEGREKLEALRQEVMSGSTEMFDYLASPTLVGNAFATADRGGIFNNSQYMANMEKNRYTNVEAWDHTLASTGESGKASYIHANHVFMGGTHCIASQGPKDDTIIDHLRMIAFNKCPVQVRLTNDVERGVAKCFNYWNEALYNQDPRGLDLGNGLRVKLDGETLKYSGPDGSLVHECKLVHFEEWPDFGVPKLEHIPKFLSLVDGLDAHFGDNYEGGPALIHCSAGIGRTGTLLAALSLWRQINRQGGTKISITDTILQLRAQRPGLVQTSDQLAFLYNVVSTMIAQK